MDRAAFSRKKPFYSNTVLKMIKGYRTWNSGSWLFFLAVIRCYLAGALAKMARISAADAGRSLFFHAHNSENSSG